MVHSALPYEQVERPEGGQSFFAVYKHFFPEAFEYQTHHSFIDTSDNKKSNSKRNQTKTTTRRTKRKNEISFASGTETHTKQHGAAAAVGCIAPITNKTSPFIKNDTHPLPLFPFVGDQGPLQANEYPTYYSFININEKQ